MLKKQTGLCIAQGLKHMEGLDNKPLALENPESPKL